MTLALAPAFRGVARSLSGPCDVRRGLAHPVTVVALGLWLANDHIWKAAYGNFWTGKLSDVASLAVFPLLPLGVAELGRWRANKLALVASCGLTAVSFALLNLTDFGQDAYVSFFSALRFWVQAPLSLLLEGTAGRAAAVSATPDASDLWTLPAVVMPAWLAWSGRDRMSP